jgi:xanthine dehydrogenase accessory factor
MVRSQPFQPPAPAEQLWIAGDIPVSRALARLAESVDFRVSLFPRVQEVLISKNLALPRIPTSPFEPHVAQISQSAAPTLAVPGIPTSALVFLDPIEDRIAVLSHWMNLPLVFLGVAAGREQRAEIIARLHAAGATREQLDRIHCPVGLPIGASSAEESAVAIIAHLIQNRSDRRISHEAASRIRSPSLIKARS